MEDTPKDMTPSQPKIKTRSGSGYLKQLYSTARTTAENTHSHLKNLTTFLVNFIPIETIDPSPKQVRTHFDPEELASLSQSIQKHGVLQPILVVQTQDRYQVLAGERRLKAAQMAGLQRIPARILSLTDPISQEIALRENLDRVDLHPIEEGEGYQILLQTQAYLTHEEMALAFGKPKSRITECIGFTRLPETTKEKLLQSGAKNRALLRALLSAPEENHSALIQRALNKEEEKPTPLQPLKKKKPFAILISEKKVQIPNFCWKPTGSVEELQDFLASLKSAVVELESLIFNTLTPLKGHLERAPE